MRRDLDYMLQVMQAAKEGKVIQYRASSAYDWIDTDIPSWNWNNADYRIKPEPPEPKYVPYENAEEFLQAQEEHGLFLKMKDGSYFMPSCVMDDAVTVDCGGMSINDRCFYFDTKCILGRQSVMDEFTWQDGTPCGKLKQ